MITLTNVSKKYTPAAINVLRDFNLQINEGEFITLIGPNGCGKSTLLRILGGLEEYDGNVSFNQPSLKVSMVFQNYRDTLLPWLTAEENLSFVLETQRIEKRLLIEPILCQLQLQEHRHKFTYQLSGGLQQKLSLARAFLLQPDLLLLDEPFSALDFHTVRSLQSDIQELWGQWKATTLFVSHDPEEAIFLGDKVVMLSGPPLKVEEIIPVNLPRPRTAEMFQSEEFMQLKQQILLKLNGVSQK